MSPLCLPRPRLRRRTLTTPLGSVEIRLFIGTLLGCRGCTELLGLLATTCRLLAYVAMSNRLVGDTFLWLLVGAYRLCRSIISGTGNRVRVLSSACWTTWHRVNLDLLPLCLHRLVVLRAALLLSISLRCLEMILMLGTSPPVYRTVFVLTRKIFRLKARFRKKPRVFMMLNNGTQTLARGLTFMKVVMKSIMYSTEVRNTVVIRCLVCPVVPGLRLS